MTFETDAEFSFTDLSDRLSGKGGAEFADSALLRLAALRGQVESRIGGGLSKEDYERFTAVSEALGCAATVMALFVKSRASAVQREVEDEYNRRN